jgi:hypothetical protein
MNYSWPVTNFADKIKAGMIVVYDGVNVATGTVVSDYKNQVTILEGTEKEQVIVKNKIQAVDTKTKKPNIDKRLDYSSTWGYYFQQATSFSVSR